MEARLITGTEADHTERIDKGERTKVKRCCYHL